MEDSVTKVEEHSTLKSAKVQSLQIQKLTPQIKKLRRDSFPVTPLSLNGSLTSVDVFDTSFGKKVIADIKANNTGIPDESFSEEILQKDKKCQEKLAKASHALSSDESLSEEVLQDIDCGLDALRDAVPVLCLNKDKKESCNDEDIFEEMSAFQVMGIFNNKGSKRPAKSFIKKPEGNNDGIKNKRCFPDKNLDILYKKERNDQPNSNDRLECTKLTGKKMDETDDRNCDLKQDNEKDSNNNDSSMETTESSEDEYDWVQEIMLSENDDNQNNNCQVKEIIDDNCELKEPNEEDNGSSTEIKAKDNIEKPDELICKKLKVKVIDISKMCKKEVVNLPKIDVRKNKPENKSREEDQHLSEEDKCTEDFWETQESELSDRLEIANDNDTMRSISKPNNCKAEDKEKDETVIETPLEHDPFSLKCSSCEYTSPKKCLLQQHNAFYHDEWLFQCTECNSGFNTKGAFERHRLVHLECKVRKRKFKCNRCSQTFFFRLSLQKHLKKHKNKEENMKQLQQRRPKQRKNSFVF